MSKLKRRSVLRDKNPIYDIKLTEKEYRAMIKSEKETVLTSFPELYDKVWWRNGRQLSWQHE